MQETTSTIGKVARIAGGCVAGVSALSAVTHAGVTIGNMIQTRRRDEQTIALANRVVDLGDQKLEQVIEVVSAQITESRQAIQATANRTMDIKSEGSPWYAGHSQRNLQSYFNSFRARNNHCQLCISRMCASRFSISVFCYSDGFWLDGHQLQKLARLFLQITDK